MVLAVLIELPQGQIILGGLCCCVNRFDRLEKICHPCAEPGDRFGDRGSGRPEISRAIGFYRNKQ